VPEQRLPKRPERVAVLPGCPQTPADLEELRCGLPLRQFDRLTGLLSTDAFAQHLVEISGRTPAQHGV
jgi:hypothetical protein